MRQPWLLLLAVGMVALAGLWIAWKIGRFLAKLGLTLALVSLAGLVLWYLLRR